MLRILWLTVNVGLRREVTGNGKTVRAAIWEVQLGDDTWCTSSMLLATPRLIRSASFASKVCLWRAPEHGPKHFNERAHAVVADGYGRFSYGFALGKHFNCRKQPSLLSPTAKRHTYFGRKRAHERATGHSCIVPPLVQRAVVRNVIEQSMRSFDQSLFSWNRQTQRLLFRLPNLIPKNCDKTLLRWVERLREVPRSNPMNDGKQQLRGTKQAGLFRQSTTCLSRQVNHGAGSSTGRTRRVLAFGRNPCTTLRRKHPPFTAGFYNQQSPGQREQLPTGVTVLRRPILSPMPLEGKRQCRDIAFREATQGFDILRNGKHNAVGLALSR